MASTVLPSSTNPAILLQKAKRLIRYDLSLENPYRFLPITFESFTCAEACSNLFRVFMTVTLHFSRDRSGADQCVVAWIIFLVFLTFSFCSGLQESDLSCAFCSEYFCFPLQFPSKLNNIQKLENPIKDPCTIQMLLLNDPFIHKKMVAK